MGRMTHPYFFGYGSLVNAQTHRYTPVYPAKARGWRRGWRAVPERSLCYLTAIRDETCEIEGLIAPVPGADWAELDLREEAYERHAAAHEISHQADTQDVAIYAIDPARLSAPGDGNAVLLSYLDVVVQGYLQVFEEAGAQRFVDTTDGWEAPILNDRAAPRYPRAQTLSAHEQQFVDDLLHHAGAQVFT